MTEFSKTFISVATKGYLAHWENLVQSIISSGSKLEDDTFVIFTDQPLEASEFLRTLRQDDKHVYSIPSHGWPEATLLRYEFMSKLDIGNVNQILIYLDADMLFHQNINEHLDFSEIVAKKSMLLVRHPGFWRGNLRTKIAIYSSNPAMMLKDIRLFVGMGALGSWEQNPESRAYVSYRMRQKYFCGGIWLGESEIFMSVVKTLAIQVTEDLKEGKIAKWHDESHLNHWASVNDFLEAGPSFCYDPIYSNLKSIPMIVEAVRK